MARFTQDVVLNKPENFVYFMMNDYLNKNGFVMSDWKGEPAYRTGDGFFESFRYLKWSYTNNTFHLEAWMKGPFGGESDLEGFVAIAIKKPFKSSLMTLMDLLQQPLPESYQNVNIDNSATATDDTAKQNTPTPIPVQTIDDFKAAQQGLIFGVLTLVFCWSLIFCLVFACLAFSRCRTGKHSSKGHLAQAGKILAIIGLCIMCILFVLNFMSTILLILA